MKCLEMNWMAILVGVSKKKVVLNRCQSEFFVKERFRASYRCTIQTNKFFVYVFYHISNKDFTNEIVNE